MKKILLASAAIVGLAVTVPMFNAQAHDPEKNGKKKLKYKIELAGDLCTAMAKSGAYTDMDADTMSAYCIHVATHIVDAPYDHVDE